MNLTKSDILRWLNIYNELLQENKRYLSDLDSPIGDADHGINMARGFGKVAEKLPSISEADIGSIFKTAAMTLLSSVGGASGPLYGTFFLRAGQTVGAKEELSTEELSQMVASGVEGIKHRGHANVGDKTMIDAWMPAVAALEKEAGNGGSMQQAISAAMDASEQGMKDTIPLKAKKGRASYLGDRSIGHQDPGATSTFLMLKALQTAIAE